MTVLDLIDDGAQFAVQLLGQAHAEEFRDPVGRDTEEVIGELNLMLKGWANYFRLGSVSKAYESVDSHVRNRLRQWLGRKHKIKGRVENHFPDEYLYPKLGVLRLTHFHTNLPWAKAK